MHALARRVARLEQRTAAQHPASCAVRYLDASPEDTAAVLAVLLDAGFCAMPTTGRCCASPMMADTCHGHSEPTRYQRDGGTPAAARTGDST
jgi:hypothetical protein